MFSKFKTLALVAAASATISASAVAAPYIDVRVAPPPPRTEVVPAARAGYAWVPGYWDWRGHRHVWMSGHWERARRGYVYREPRWEQSGDRWRLNRGMWARGDRDGDGVPNAVDRHPDNPRRP
ncbi:MAG TPA: YXWGXW repeat-containing protein [Caldimonas sp.]|nr:YXWGXW repeat-containing protein [Caldimonas sp.]